MGCPSLLQGELIHVHNKTCTQWLTIHNCQKLGKKPKCPSKSKRLNRLERLNTRQHHPAFKTHGPLTAQQRGQTARAYTLCDSIHVTVWDRWKPQGREEGKSCARQCCEEMEPFCIPAAGVVTWNYTCLDSHKYGHQTPVHFAVCNLNTNTTQRKQCHSFLDRHWYLLEVLITLQITLQLLSFV